MRKVLYALLVILNIFVIYEVKAYTEYKIGDEIEYNNIKFYVIKDSSSDEDSVTMLKRESLTYEDVQMYSSGRQTNISNQNGYGGINFVGDYYGGSNIKNMLESWANAKFKDNDLTIDSTGYSVRMLSTDDLNDNLGYDVPSYLNTAICVKLSEYVPKWIWNKDYEQWLMTKYPYWPTISRWWVITQNGDLYWRNGRDNFATVRPVVTLKKGVFDNEEIINNSTENNADEYSDSKVMLDNKEIIPDNKENIIDEDKIDNNYKTIESKTNVKVDNTYESRTIIIIILGFIIALASIFILYKLSNKR